MKCNKRQHSNEIKPNKHQKTLETIIKNTTQMWCADPIHLRNPLQFLQLSSHCINDNYMEASMVHKSITSSSSSSAPERDDLNGRHFNAIKSNSMKKTKLIPAKEFRKQFTTTSERIDVTSADINSTSNHTKSILNGNDKIKKSSDPPPLAFFPRSKGKPQKPIIFSATEPPPLVPIARNFA